MQTEFVENKITGIIGYEEVDNIDEIRDLAKIKCAIDIISTNVEEEISQLLYGSYEYSPNNYVNKFHGIRFPHEEPGGAKNSSNGNP